MCYDADDTLLRGLMNADFKLICNVGHTVPIK
jgi:hypothetical protein